MIDTTMVVLFFQGKDIAKRVRKVRRVAGPLATVAYEADFDGVPTVHVHDEHGHVHNFEPHDHEPPAG